MTGTVKQLSGCLCQLLALAMFALGAIVMIGCLAKPNEFNPTNFVIGLNSVAVGYALLCIGRMNRPSTVTPDTTNMNFELVGSFVTESEATVASMYLRSYDIHVFDVRMGDALAGLNSSAGFQLRVPARQASLALELLAEPDLTMDKNGPEEGSPSA